MVNNRDDAPKAAPVLGDRDRLELELAIAQWETAELRVQLLQSQARELKAELDRRLQAAALQGYLLQRTTTGQWQYSPTVQTNAAGSASSTAAG